MGRWTNGWLVEGRIIPHALGPGSQPGNEAARVLEEFGAKSNSEAFPLSSFVWAKESKQNARLSVD